LFNIHSSWEGHKNQMCVEMCKEAEADIKTRTQNVKLTVT